MSYRVRVPVAARRARLTFVNPRRDLAAVALYFMWYNFGRVHQTLRVTPAMEAGLTNHVWSVEEIVALMDRPR
jgi:hypothetical protein